MIGTTATFEWQVPTRVVFGRGRVGSVGLEAAALGSRIAVFVDRQVNDLPVTRQVLDSLCTGGTHVAAMITVDGPPRHLDLQEHVLQVGRAACDSVVALGGGSAMDAAKLVALAATNPGLLDPAAFAAGRVISLDVLGSPRRRPGLPTLLVPTTAATGSELNTVAALTCSGHKHLVVSGLLAPSTALIDPDLSGTLSGRQLAEGGVETFARIISPYLVPGSALPSTDAQAEVLAARCLSVTDAVQRDPDDAEARADLAWVVAVSATQLVGLGRADWSHCLWYLQDPVAEVAGTTKGPAMAALLPAYLSEIRDGTPLGRRLGSAARLDGLSHALAPSLQVEPADVIVELEALLAGWNLPTCLEDLGLDSMEVEHVVDLTLEAWGSTGRLDGLPRADLATFHGRARHASVGHPNRSRPPGSERSTSILGGR